MIEITFTLDRKIHVGGGCSSTATEFDLSMGLPIWCHLATPCGMCAESLVVFKSDESKIYHLEKNCEVGRLSKTSFSKIYRLKYRPCEKCANDTNLLNLWTIAMGF